MSASPCSPRDTDVELVNAAFAVSSHLPASERRVCRRRSVVTGVLVDEGSA